MGQLEKYGLYVLCLLIFLILGVTLWGSGTVNANPKGEKPAVQRLEAGRGSGDARPAGQGDSGTKLPNFRELLAVDAPPKKAASPTVGEKPAAEPKGGSAPGGDNSKPKPVSEKPPPSAEKRPTYKIQRGDNYESIARERFGVRALATEIARLNPRLDPRKLRPGNEILVPTQAEADTFIAKRAAKKAGVAVGGSYTIARGDTLIGIAKRKLGSERRLAEIQALNPGVDPVNLRVGATIRLPAR